MNSGILIQLVKDYSKRPNDSQTDLSLIKPPYILYLP